MRFKISVKNVRIQRIAKKIYIIKLKLNIKKV